MQRTHLMVYYLVVLVSYLVEVQTSLVYSLYNTPNYRTMGNLPLSNTVADCWLLATSIMPASGWLGSGIGALPYNFGGGTGIGVGVAVVESGQYVVRIGVDASARLESIVNFQYNSALHLQHNNTGSSIIIFDIPNNWTAGNNTLYLWGDQGIAIINIDIIHYKPVTVVLEHVPSLNLLYIITDLPLNMIVNASMMAQMTRVQLVYRANLGSQCLESNGSTTNPADWARYASNTNFSTLASAYTYVLSPGSTNTTTSLIIAVSPIQIDCTVEAVISLPMGSYLVDNLTTVFTITTPNPLPTFLETYVPKNVTYSFVYDIIHQRLLAYFHQILFDTAIDFVGLNNKNMIDIAGGACEIFWRGNSYTDTCFVCQNMSTWFTWNSSVTINVPGGYIRDPGTKELLVMSFVDGGRNFLNQYDASVNVTYYLLEQTISIVYNITISADWSTKLNTTHTQIFINSVQIPPANITLIKNPNNLVEVETVLSMPLNDGDMVNVTFESFWNQLQTVQGYNNKWYVGQGFPISKLPSKFLPVLLPQLDQPQAVNNFQIPLLITRYAGSGWNLFFFSFFINSFVAFQNLAIMYYFVGFKYMANVYRKQLIETIILINQQVNYQNIIKRVFNIGVSLRMIKNESDYFQDLPTKYQALHIYELQYSLDFLSNTFINLLLIFFVLFKIAIIKILILVIPCQLLKKLLIRIYQNGRQIFLFEILMTTPQIFVILGTFLRPECVFGYDYFMFKLNFFLVISMGFACLCSILMIFHIGYGKKEPINLRFVAENDNSNTDKGLIKNNAKFHRHLNCLFDNCLYIFVPFLAATGQSYLFIPGMTFVTTFRIVFIIRNRKLWGCGEFMKDLMNKFLWFMFNLVYLFYWALQLINLDCTKGIMPQVLAVCDIMETSLLVGGCLFELTTNSLSIICSIIFTCKDFLKEKVASKQKIQNVRRRQMAKVQNYSTNDKEQVVGNTNRFFTPKVRKIPKQIYKVPHSSTDNAIFKMGYFIRMQKSLKKKAIKNEGWGCNVAKVCDHSK